MLQKTCRLLRFLPPRSCLLVWALWVTLVFPLESRVESLRILTIGNSFADNACQYLKKIAESNGQEVEIRKANIGGASLERHWKGVEAWEADPTDPKGRPYAFWEGGKRNSASLEEQLRDGPWDYVTIQQVSIQSFRPETFEPVASQLIAYIREHAPDAEILIHQTWAYRVDHGIFNRSDFDQEAMYRQLSENYLALSERHGGLRIIPAGSGFQLARNSPQWNLQIPDFDPQTSVYPELPDTRQSLITGWKWSKRDGEQVLVNDRIHAGTNGKYLAGLIWYGVLFHQDPRSASFRPEGKGPRDSVSEEDAALLRELAFETLVAKHEWF